LQEIEQILIDKGIEYKINSNNPYEINMKCFSGEHVDSNPSLSYNVEKGVFNCFSCGFKGDTNKLMKELGIVFTVEPLSKQAFKIKRLQDKLEALRGDKPIYLPEPRFPIKHSFKGISYPTMLKFGAFMTTHDSMDDYVCIPVYQGGKLKFIEGRHSLLNVKNTSMPKYMRRPAGVDVSTVLFPLDAVTDFTQVILVEGIFDALNMHDMGYTNTLCVFGTNNFTAGKAKMLDERGCRHAIIMMDGDNPGRQAAVKIQKLLSQRSIHTTIINMEDGKDPGSIDELEAEAYLSEFIID
jgi:5S rRNA maturation endonuclease (ribonuclease M5)